MTDRSRELETELIRQVREGRREFFEPLVRAYEPEAHRIALAIMGDRDAASDAVQEAFIKAYRALDRFELGRSFRPWFLQILRNQCRDMHRRRKAGFDTQPMTPVMAERLPSSSDPERLRHRAEARAILWEALGRISVDHREVLVLKEIQGLRYDEIAEAIEVPEGTVASRLYHARRALKEALDEMGVEYP
ncbi:MAG: sigma-70 family RNA polymerase sigma factor [Longimicrobiales bacterium]|nr:sigma-70 family RNA polymerase sigma factor [Longimicrobiales bacterium]